MKSFLLDASGPRGVGDLRVEMPDKADLAGEVYTVESRIACMQAMNLATLVLVLDDIACSLRQLVVARVTDP